MSRSWLQSVCVFSGSRTGARAAYRTGALELSQALIARQVRLVYGGGDIGLMGVMADFIMANEGEAVGVIPRFLQDREVAHKGLTALHVVETMHQRKGLMADLSDAFIAIPGGYGTLEELFEIVTWSQLGLHEKPCGLLNIDGFFDHLLTFLDRCVEDDFIRREHRERLVVESDPVRLLDRIEADLSARTPPRSADVDRR